MQQELTALAHKGGTWTRASLLKAGFTSPMISEAIRVKLLEAKLNGTFEVAPRARLRITEAEEMVPGDTVMRVVNGQLKPFQVVGQPNGGRLSLVDPEDPNARVEQVNQADAAEPLPGSPGVPPVPGQPVPPVSNTVPAIKPQQESRLMQLLGEEGKPWEEDEEDPDGEKKPNPVAESGHVPAPTPQGGGLPKPTPGQNLEEWALQVGQQATLDQFNNVLRGCPVNTISDNDSSVIEDVIDDEQGMGAMLENGGIYYLSDLTMGGAAPVGESKTLAERILNEYAFDDEGGDSQTPPELLTIITQTGAKHGFTITQENLYTDSENGFTELYGDYMDSHAESEGDFEAVMSANDAFVNELLPALDAAGYESEVGREDITIHPKKEATPQAPSTPTGEDPQLDGIVGHLMTISSPDNSRQLSRSILAVTRAKASGMVITQEQIKANLDADDPEEIDFNDEFAADAMEVWNNIESYDAYDV